MNLKNKIRSLLIQTYTVQKMQKRQGSLPKFPFLTTEGARLLTRLLTRREPIDDAMHVETMRATTPHQGTIVSRQLALRTTRLEGVATDPTGAVVRAPSPSSHAEPVLDLQKGKIK